MGPTLLMALALLLILEGVLPFLAPNLWRETFRRLTQMNDGQIRFIGLSSMVVGVLLASLSLGMVLSSISQTESQAVQFAMLTLLAALFFSGFVLGLDSLTYPVKLISWTLPVTYGIRSFQTVMLLGETPNTADIVGLSALVIVYGAIAALALRRGLRSS